MYRFQRKRKLSHYLESYVVLVLLLLIFIILGLSTIRAYFKSRAVIDKNTEIEKEIANLEKRKKELKKEIDKLQSEFGQEEELREKFEVKKPGEKVLIIIDKQEENDKIETGQDNRGLFNFFEKIKSFFGW